MAKQRTKAAITRSVPDEVKQAIEEQMPGFTLVDSAGKSRHMVGGVIDRVSQSSRRTRGIVPVAFEVEDKDGQRVSITYSETLGKVTSYCG